MNGCDTGWWAVLNVVLRAKVQTLLKCRNVAYHLQIVTGVNIAGAADVVRVDAALVGLPIISGTRRESRR